MNDLCMNEAQNSSAETKPETAPKSDQKPIQSESKPKRGGKRPGAGRKPNLAKRLLKGVTHATITDAVANIDIAMVIAS